MNLLSAESGELLLTEDSYYIIVEPEGSTFVNRFAGVAVIIDKGSFFEMNLGRGPIRAQLPQQLETEALNSGASGVIYK